MPAAAVVRRRLEAQGFHLDDAALAEIGPWLRWSPALCAALVAVATVLASPPALWTLAALAAVGAALPAHPFDIAYNHLVRRLTRTRPLPRHGPQRRFACALAAVWLTATGFSFAHGAAALGYALGGTLAAVAALVGTTHFCIPSLVYNKLFGRGPAAAPSVARGA